MEDLSKLIERMKKGARLEIDDLPESLHTLVECIRIHYAEYAVKYADLQNKLDDAYHLLGELRESGDYGSRYDEKITQMLVGQQLGRGS